jgi:multisubunit Na+/H+ antiporter MnhG subunit
MEAKMAKKRRMSLLEQTEQPMRWGRAIWSGIFGVTVMMAFVDIYYLMGLTPFSYEQYLGSLLRGTNYGQENWTVGFFANWVVGGAIGCLYAWAFEWVFKKSGTRYGVFLGLIHAAIAAIAIFPFFNVLHAESGTQLYPNFGFFGSGLGAATPILLLTGNLIFGATAGLLYGPVRSHRIRARAYEPGELIATGDDDQIGQVEGAPLSELTQRQRA